MQNGLSKQMHELINYRRDNLHVEILFCRIAYHLDPEIRKMLERGLHWNEDSMFHSAP